MDTTISNYLLPQLVSFHPPKMTGIRVISAASIKPATSNHNHLTRRIELSPWDLQLLLVNSIQKGILFHKPTPQHEKQLGSSDVIDHLKISLALALDIFYPLAGRLVMVQHHDDTTSFFVDCNNTGAQFVHAIADGISVADILDADYVPDIVDSFFLFQRLLNCDGVSTPLLGVQVTELVDGFFIGCTANHLVVDGTGFWDFFNTWSEISRNSGETSQPPPVFDRSCLKRGVFDFPLRFPFPQFETLNRPVLTHPPQKIFHFSKHRIEELKAKANLEMGTNKISSLQVLLAHLWRVINRHGSLPTDHEMRYKILVGTRQRIQPPLPETYTGNAVLLAAASTTVGDLLSHGPGWAAWQINRAIASQGVEEVKQFLESWVKNPHLIEISELATKTINNLLTGSSPRFNVYGNDFGWGKPIAVLSGSANKLNGKLTVYPGKEEGSIDFECSLSKEILDAMVNDAEFMEALAP